MNFAVALISCRDAHYSARTYEPVNHSSLYIATIVRTGILSQTEIHHGRLAKRLGTVEGIGNCIDDVHRR